MEGTVVESPTIKPRTFHSLLNYSDVENLNDGHVWAGTFEGNHVPDSKKILCHNNPQKFKGAK